MTGCPLTVIGWVSSGCSEERVLSQEGGSNRGLVRALRARKVLRGQTGVLAEDLGQRCGFCVSFRGTVRKAQDFSGSLVAKILDC